MRSFLYPANFTPAEEGGFVVTFRDVPEAITQGETPSECIEQAVDALDEAMIGRMNTGTDLPLPSDHERGQFLIPVPAQTAFKAALYEEIKSQSLSKVQLAARLGVDEKEVRRLLDPHHSSKLPRIAEILERVGKHIVVGVQNDEAILPGT
jgi:antitoxin HicB